MRKNQVEDDKGIYEAYRHVNRLIREAQNHHCTHHCLLHLLFFFFELSVSLLHGLAIICHRRREDEVPSGGSLLSPSGPRFFKIMLSDALESGKLESSHTSLLTSSMWPSISCHFFNLTLHEWLYFSQCYTHSVHPSMFPWFWNKLCNFSQSYTQMKVSKFVTWSHKVIWTMSLHNVLYFQRYLINILFVGFALLVMGCSEVSFAIEVELDLKLLWANVSVICTIAYSWITSYEISVQSMKILC